MKPTVRQHYVPACYLARFSLQGQRDSRFFVHFLDGKVREGTPESIGFEKHYHTIEVPGLAPDHLENIFQQIENPACALFKTLSDNPGYSLTESEKNSLLMFFAVQAARTPRSRNQYHNLILDCGRAFMHEVAHSPEFFGRVMEVAARQGLTFEPAVQEGLREAVDGGHIFPQVGKNQSAVGMFRLAEAILGAVDGMHYTLWYSDGPEFVCSDYPVGLFYRLSVDDPLAGWTNPETPTITMLTDTVFMPLSHTVAVAFHRLEGLPTAQRANKRMVAIVNTVTISHAQRFICSATEDFVCVLPDRQLGNAKEAVEATMSFA